MYWFLFAVIVLQLVVIIVLAAYFLSNMLTIETLRDQVDYYRRHSEKKG